MSNNTMTIFCQPTLTMNNILALFNSFGLQKASVDDGILLVSELDWLS